MGVRGLTTYLKNNRHKVSYTLELSSKGQIHDGNSVSGTTSEITVVVDGWSLLYSIYNLSGEPWVYGGEYAALSNHARDIVLAWRRAGIRATIVFDGPASPMKYPTLVSRLQDNCIKPANLFFRTSAAARSTPRSLAETRIAPPLAYSAIVSTLLSMEGLVDVEFAEGEADPHIVALAGRLGAYVMANDSDFVVLNCEGYKGYIPLDDMVWCAIVKDTDMLSTDSFSVAGGDDDAEFQVVTKKKSKSKQKIKDSRLELGTGPIPPSSQDYSEWHLVLTVFEPSILAGHLSLPTSLLPLLGSLIGNDYASFDFFRSSESIVERVERVAETLSSVVKDAQSPNVRTVRKIARGSHGGVMDVIGTTIERLLLWRDPKNPPSSAQIDEITERVVLSTLEYAVHESVSLFPEDEGDATSSLGSRSHHNVTADIRQMYIEAFHSGVMHPLLMQTFAKGVCFPRLFLEDPDRESCVCSISRPIREVIWRIFAKGGGIPSRSDPSTEPEEQGDAEDYTDEMFAEDDEEELIDVVEEWSDDDEIPFQEDDPLAVLRGRLQRLSFSENGGEQPKKPNLSVPSTVPSSPPNEEDILDSASTAKVVTEYVRRGQRVAAEDSVVAGLDDLFWNQEDRSLVQMRTLSERLDIFLKILRSDTPSIRELASETLDVGSSQLGGELLAILTLRWVLQMLHDRAEEVEGNRKRDREKEKWTRSECEAFLWIICADEEVVETPPIQDRSVQLTAQILAATEAIQWLAQALLLMKPPGAASPDSKPFSLGQSEHLFSGRKFHSALALHRKGSTDLYDKLHQAALEGLEAAVAEERGKRGKKERKAKQNAGNVPIPVVEGSGRFGALAALGME
ncbi:hypothetical protein M422DRAFT_26742 [Sphaerobolus stellatus SS14]|nr:hypothetical protein M422DRAFT_26742 [Sphaerobolus stellatus SS14]